MNQPNYETHFGQREFRNTTMTPAEQVLDTMYCHLKDVIEQSYRRFPLANASAAAERWARIEAALLQAKWPLDICVKGRILDKTRLDMELEQAKEANDDGDKDAVLWCAGAFLYVYERAMGDAA